MKCDFKRCGCYIPRGCNADEWVTKHPWCRWQLLTVYPFHIGYKTRLNTVTSGYCVQCKCVKPGFPHRPTDPVNSKWIRLETRSCFYFFTATRSTSTSCSVTPSMFEKGRRRRDVRSNSPEWSMGRQRVYVDVWNHPAHSVTISAILESVSRLHGYIVYFRTGRWYRCLLCKIYDFNWSK